MEEKCPCQTDTQACCACVSMHCDECHKPRRSKFVQGRFCSNCGRPLKDELTPLYVPKSEVDELAEELSDLIVEKDHLFDEVVRLRVVVDEYEETSGLKQAKAEVAREIFEEIYEDCFDQFGYINYEALAELKKKYTEGKT